MVWPAPQHSVFAPDAFQQSIGKEVIIRLPDDVTVVGRVCDARVEPDGTRVVVSFDVPRNVPGLSAERASE